MAEVARAVLESHGIAAAVSASDLFGYDFSFASGGAKLLVKEDFADSAEEVLASMQELSDPSEIEVSESQRSDGRQTLLRIGVAIIGVATVVGWLFHR